MTSIGRAPFLVAATLMMSATCLSDAQERPNPLLSRSALPFHAPAFDKIVDTDFKAAFEAGIAEQRADVQKILASPAAPTFENTIEALERAGQGLTRAQLIFNGLTSANTNDT